MAQNPKPEIEAQKAHWEMTLATNPEMYGPEPSVPGQYAAKLFQSEGLTRILELGSGQGRDTLGFLRAGFEIDALDYAAEALAQVGEMAGVELASRLRTTVHDIRDPLPFADNSFDACYSHMLFNMALGTDELVKLAAEVCRVLRPGGPCVYTVRHTEDAHFGAGTSLGDNLFENGGFVVHFFDRSLVELLAAGFELDDVIAFEEGGLPRLLWQVTMHKL